MLFVDTNKPIDYSGAPSGLNFLPIRYVFINREGFLHENGDKNQLSINMKKKEKPLAEVGIDKYLQHNKTLDLG